MTDLHVLSVRRSSSQDCDPRGVEIGPSVLALRGSSRAYILIHGFANSTAKANESYRSLIREVENTIWPGRIDKRSPIFGYHWPSDHPNRFKSTASFSTRVGVATSAGHHLGALLETLDSRTEVVLVAHSLGCRVALGALDYLKSGHSRRGATIRSVILMAAAVPVDTCSGAEQFAGRYARRYTVLHSRRDRVLQWCFPPGQSLFDRAATAVGRNGGPDGLRWDQKIDTKLGHSQYWSSATAASLLASLLPITVPRSVRRRHLEIRSAIFDSEDTVRAVPSRTLPAR